jgi:hypothetical protein
MYLGSVAINDYIEWEVNTHDPTADGAESDADALPTYRIYEENNNTVLLSGNLAKRDDANTLGYYYARIQATSVSGFEVGKRYYIRTRAVVTAIAGSKVDTFLCVATGHDVESIALSAAGAEAACDASLATYDPPTKTEMDNKIDGLNNLSAANIATELATYDPPTKIEMDNKIDGLNNLSAANIAIELAT